MRFCPRLNEPLSIILNLFHFHPLALYLKNGGLFFLPPTFVATNEIEIADGKAAPGERPLLIAIERRQFRQKISIRDGGHDVGPGSGEELLPRITDLLEIELRGG